MFESYVWTDESTGEQMPLRELALLVSLILQWNSVDGFVIVPVA